jgi:hypothetical protein
MPSGACVIRYQGARGVVWRVKYADAEGRQVMETVGAERDGFTRKQARQSCGSVSSASTGRATPAQSL